MVIVKVSQTEELAVVVVVIHWRRSRCCLAHLSSSRTAGRGSGLPRGEAGRELQDRKVGLKEHIREHIRGTTSRRPRRHQAQPWEHRAHPSQEEEPRMRREQRHTRHTLLQVIDLGLLG